MINSSLPSYPCERDVWDELRSESRPIVVYGMGNGADKLFRRFEKYGIKVSDVFASDGFVRGHSYRNYQVISFSDVKNKYDDFVIVLSFASNRDEVIKMLSDIDSNYDLYIPDMPVADEEEYFDREFYNKNYEKIKAVYEILSDDESKNIFASVVNYKLFARLSYLLDSISDKDEMYKLINSKPIKLMIDGGAYNGDTAKEAIKYFPYIEEIVALEPDKKTFKRLLKYCEIAEKKVTPINAALFDRCDSRTFFSSGNRNSTASATVSYEHKNDLIDFITMDSLNLSPDYIKYDVEGAEYEALIGSLKTIEISRPILLVSLYHRSRDIFFLPLFLTSKLNGYRLFLRRLKSVPAWELNLILIPT